MYKVFFSFLKVLPFKLATNSPLAILFPSTVFSLQQFFPLPKASHIQKAFPIRQPKAKVSKQRQSLASSFSESFTPSGRQGGAAVLWEGRDIVTGETCVPASLSKQLRKSSCSAFPSSVARAVPISASR
jgi:hypothetical protein